MYKSSQGAYGAQSTIFDAVKKGDIQMIDRMLHRNKNIFKESDSTGSRPIHIAARNCQVEVLKHLDKIDPVLLQTRNDSGMTVLHFAVQNSDKKNRKECLECLRFILDRTNPDTLFEAADTDKSSELSYEELFTAYGHVIGPDLLKRIFAEVDEDKSGEISLEEFKKALSNGSLTPLPLVKVVPYVVCLFRYAQSLCPHYAGIASALCFGAEPPCSMRVTLLDWSASPLCAPWVVLDVQ